MPKVWRFHQEFGYATLREALESLKVDDLKYRARLFQSKPPTRKAELVAHLQHQLKGPGLRRLWEELDDLSQKAVSEAVHSPTEPLNTALFRAKYGANPPSWYRFYSAYQDRTKNPPDPISMLIFGEGWIPNDLQKRLEEFVPEPAEPVLTTVDELPSHPPSYDSHGRPAGGDDDDDPDLIREDTAPAALHDVRAVLALIDTGKVKVGAKTGQVSLAGAKAILPVLRNGDFLLKQNAAPKDAKDTIRPFVWPLLFQAGKLAQSSGSTLRLTNAGKKAMTAPPHKLIRDLWTRWLKSKLFDEFRRVREVKGQTKSGALTAVTGRREAITRGLQNAKPGQWIQVDEFMRYLLSSGQGFDVAKKEWSLYLSDAHYGSFGENPTYWLPKWYAMVFLWEYAGTLGLIDVAFTGPEGARADYTGNWGGDWLDCLSPHDGLFYFRINTLGAWVLGLASEFVPPAEEVRPVLRVLPNFEVTVTGQPLSPSDALFLNRIARRKNERVWALELAGLLQAVEDGLPLSDIKAFLQAKCAEPGLPETVIKLFGDAANRVDRIVDRGPARIYACDDPVLANLVANDTRLRKLCHLAGDRLLAVPAEADKTFRHELRRLGYVAPPPSAG